MGTFDLDRSDRPNRDFARPSEAAELDEGTEELFNDAIAALDAGHDAEAQRLFERMIARAPDSELAGEARSHLAALYAAKPEEPASPSPRGQTYSVANGPFDQAIPAQQLAAQHDKPVPVALEEQFVTEAGDRVFFSSGSAELGSRARYVLEAQARFIKRRPDLDATVEGHADDAPLSPEEHLRLSEARALAVRDRLVAEGLEEGRVIIASYGRDRPVVNCDNPGCAAQNRRAVTVLVSARVRQGQGAPASRPRDLPIAGNRPDPLTH